MTSSLMASSTTRLIMSVRKSYEMFDSVMTATEDRIVAITTAAGDESVEFVEA